MINIVEKISPTEDISQDDFGVRVKGYKTLNIILGHARHVRH